MWQKAVCPLNSRSERVGIRCVLNSTEQVQVYEFKPYLELVCLCVFLWLWKWILKCASSTSRKIQKALLTEAASEKRNWETTAGRTETYLSLYWGLNRRGKKSAAIRSFLWIKRYIGLRWLRVVEGGMHSNMKGPETSLLILGGFTTKRTSKCNF